jgi:hypothetical protein
MHVTNIVHANPGIWGCECHCRDCGHYSNGCGKVDQGRAQGRGPAVVETWCYQRNSLECEVKL